MDTGELLAAARAPLTRSGIADLAARVKGADEGAAFDAALAAGEVDAGIALLVAATLAGRPPDAARLGRVYPFLETFEIELALVGRARGDRVAMLLDVVETRVLDPEREALALYLAAEFAGSAEPAPPRLVSNLRRVARFDLEGDAQWLVGLAARKLKDPHLSRIAEQAIEEAETVEAKQFERELRARLREPLERSIPEHAGGGEAGLPIQGEGARVGRNDPCPCGSGKKYKKCCGSGAGAPAPAAAAAPAAGSAPVSELSLDQVRRLSLERFRMLRPQALARLDFTQLPTDKVVAALRDLSLYREWAGAERAARALDGRTGPEGGLEVDAYLWEIFSDAVAAGDRDAAARLLAQLKDPSAITATDRLALDLLAPGADLLAKIEAATLAVLKSGDDAEVAGLAHALLPHYPGLGILAARAGLGVVQPAAAYSLMWSIEEARDRLLLPPEDPAWTVYDLLAEESAGDEAEGGEGAESGGRSENAAEIAEALEGLKRRAAEARANIARLERTKRQQEAELAAAQGHAQGSSPGGAEAAEVERLRAKVEEFKAQIAEGNRERADLREQLAETAERLESAPAESADKGAAAGEGDATAADPLELDEAPPERLPILVPAFARNAQEGLHKVPAHVARAALVTAGELAGGEEATWGRVKRLSGLERVWSIRLGIHFRMFFRAEGEEGRLLVLEVMSRSDQDAAIHRLRRAP